MKALILSACLAQVSFMTFLAWAAFSAFAPGSTSTQSSLENIAETPASDLQDLAMCLNVKDEVGMNEREL